MTLDRSWLVEEEAGRSPKAGLGFAGYVIDRAFPSLRVGHLRIVLPNGKVVERWGKSGGDIEATLTAHRWRALWRMFRGGERGFADGYIAGDWSSHDLQKLLLLCLQNEEELAGRANSTRFALVCDRLFHRRRQNTRAGSRRNIAAHYDLGNEFYRPWLDRGMNYSAAIYSGDETLEEAQEAKLDRAADLLELAGGEQILEIGCGWGALAELLARGDRCKVRGITLSAEQLAYARKRLASSDSAGSAKIDLIDYRDVEGKYDRIVSIEMLEAVGEKYWPTYFSKLRTLLSKGGVAVLQVITIHEDRYDHYRRHPDFIQRHIFPGGMLPTSSIVEREAARAGLKLVHQESFGQSYAKTLQEWRNRFIRSWPNIEPLGFDQHFQRMWEYYLAYCEVGFQTGAVDVQFFKLAG